jgi:hypothetical protein
VFSKGDSLTYTGSWQVASLRFFAYDPANPAATDALTANPFPAVTLYDTLTRRSRTGAPGVLVSADAADLTGVVPSRGQVRMITFEWPAN